MDTRRLGAWVGILHRHGGAHAGGEGVGLWIASVQARPLCTQPESSKEGAVAARQLGMASTVGSGIESRWNPAYLSVPLPTLALGPDTHRSPPRISESSPPRISESMSSRFSGSLMNRSDVGPNARPLRHRFQGFSVGAEEYQGWRSPVAVVPCSRSRGSGEDGELLD